MCAPPHALSLRLSKHIQPSVNLVTKSHLQGATMALPILFDCDPGHDDAIAIVLALASPELDVKAITSSAGNQTPDKTLR
ncbi:nucleoside hydrolase, partial [Mycobacterium kansasii]